MWCRSGYISSPSNTTSYITLPISLNTYTYGVIIYSDIGSGILVISGQINSVTQATIFAYNAQTSLYPLYAYYNYVLVGY